MKRQTTNLDRDNPQKGYISAYDGLRGISILLVVLNHFTVPLHPVFDFLRDRGHLGVEVFFAVSGFLVMRSLHVCHRNQHGASGKTLKEFYIRRGVRIFFPYFATLGCVFALALATPSLKDKLISIGDILPSFFLYYYNYAKFWTAGKVPGALNIMWSLCFEEQFYIFLGVSYWLVKKQLKPFLLAVCLLSIVARLITVTVNPAIGFNQLQFWTHLRLDAILWGCLVYLYRQPLSSFVDRYKWSQWLIIAGVVFAFLLGAMNSSMLMDGIVFSMTALFFSLFLLIAPQGIFAKVLSVAPLVWIGKVSYEIYLTHQIVNGLANKVGLQQWPLLYALVLMGSSIAIASGFYVFVNRPIQEKLRKTLIRSSRS